MKAVKRSKLLRSVCKVLLVSLYACLLLGATGSDLNQSIQDLSSSDSDVRREASERLIRSGPPAVELTVRVLRQGDAPVRREAAFVLGAIGGADAKEALLGALGDEDPDVSMAAVWGLVRQGEAAVSDLIRVLGSRNDLAALGAETALAKIGSPAVPGILQALGTDDRELCVRLIRLLGSIGDSRARKALEGLLKEGDEALRGEAEVALDRLRRSGS